MVKNPEGPPQQRTEQSSESAARKQVAVRACQDRAQSKFKKKKKKKNHSQEITMQLTQKSKAGKGREVRSRVPGWRTNKWELAAEAIQV